MHCVSNIKKLALLSFALPLLTQCPAKDHKNRLDKQKSSISVNTEKDGSQASRCVEDQIEHEHDKIREQLKKAGVRINDVDGDGKTTVHYAAIEGDVDKLMYLLTQKPCLLNAVDNDGKTALHYAAKKGCERIVKQLTAVGARVG